MVGRLHSFWGELWSFTGVYFFQIPPKEVAGGDTDLQPPPYPGHRQSWITWMAEPFLIHDFEWNAWNVHENIVLVPHIGSWISSGRITPTIQILFYYLTTKNKHDTNNHTSGTNLTSQTTNIHILSTSQTLYTEVREAHRKTYAKNRPAGHRGHHGQPIISLSNVSTVDLCVPPGLDLILCPGWSMFSGRGDPRLRGHMKVVIFGSPHITEVIFVVTYYHRWKTMIGQTNSSPMKNAGWC